MRAYLARRWFLLLVVGGAVLIWRWPAAMRWTRFLDPSLTGALAVLLSSWCLETRRLLRALARPATALWALGISYGLLPALAWALGHLLPAADLRAGLLLIASVPCTLASAVIWTRMAGGNEATALLIVLLTNLLSWLVTTAWLTLAAGIEGAGTAAVPMMGKLILILVLPVGVGQLMRLSGPLSRTATRHRPVLAVIARLLTAAIMFKAAVEVRDRLDLGETPVHGGLLVAAAVLCLAAHLGAFAGGFVSSKVLGFDRPDQIAVAVAGSQKTLPIALILFDAYFQDYPLAVVPLVFFHVGQLVVDTYLADRLAARRPGEALPPPAQKNYPIPVSKMPS
jgi:sodium/bile acid cotransporter 7